MSRKYFSHRKNPDASRLDLPMLVNLFKTVYLDFLKNDYFYKNSGDVPGKLGADLEAQMLIKLKKPDLWPIEEKCNNYSEDDLFDVIEFLYDNVSKPIDLRFPKNGNYYYETFDMETGKQEFRDSMNQLLCDYREGYELSENGEILEFPEQKLEDLVLEELPPYDPENVEQRVQSAILKFRRSRSSLDGKRDAVRDLCDVLEFLRRPHIKALISSQDESDLFNIANNFGLRHHENTQKQDYDKAIWYNWMFYYYLATIHACLKLIKKAENQSP
jgi:hypothetical protein